MDKVNVKPMEAGEFEIRKAFEETTIKNIQACVQFSNDTRLMVREMAEHVEHLQNLVMMQNAELEQLRAQLAALLQEKVKGGS
jgi:uncharacterized coiled-coil protein SlyX